MGKPRKISKDQLMLNVRQLNICFNLMNSTTLPPLMSNKYRINAINLIKWIYDSEP